MKRDLIAVALVAALSVLGVIGCGDSGPDATPSATEGAQEDGGEAANEPAGLARLSSEDAASAKAQGVCPVSGEPLGSMGAPQKVQVKDQQVWICCDACQDRLMEKPEEYLAKLRNE